MTGGPDRHGGPGRRSPRRSSERPARGAPPGQAHPRRYDDDDRYRSHRHGGYPSHYQGRSRKKSFLDDLFG
jgi:hypothetical protein